MACAPDDQLSTRITVAEGSCSQSIFARRRYETLLIKRKRWNDDDIAELDDGAASAGAFLRDKFARAPGVEPGGNGVGVGGAVDEAGSEGAIYPRAGDVKTLWVDLLLWAVLSHGVWNH